MEKRKGRPPRQPVQLTSPLQRVAPPTAGQPPHAPSQRLAFIEAALGYVDISSASAYDDVPSWQTFSHLAALAKAPSKGLVNSLRWLATCFAFKSANNEDSNRDALTAAARILQMVHEALSRNDVATLRSWESNVYRYTNELIPLQPRRGPMRARAVREVLAYAKEAINSPNPPQDDGWIGWHMAQAITTWFPELGARSEMTEEEWATRIVVGWKAAKKTHRPDPELLVVEAFVAFGISRTAAHNWIKGALTVM